MPVVEATVNQAACEVAKDVIDFLKPVMQGDGFTVGDGALTVLLAEHLEPHFMGFCESPCGHSSQYAYTEDGGKNIVCLLCERQELKEEIAGLQRNLFYML